MGVTCWYRDWSGVTGGHQEPSEWKPGTLINTAYPDSAHVVRLDGTLGVYLFENVRVTERQP